MKLRMKLGVATAAAAFAMGGAASAATFIDTWTVNPTTGAISVVIGDTGLGVSGGSSSSQGISTQSYDAATGKFTDTFDFSLPTGNVGSSVTSSDTKNNLVFTGITFNGVNGMIGPTPAGLPSAGITDQFVTAGGKQELIITGSGLPAASFGGTVNFSPLAAVPEPASWALMIIGFGSAGALMRRRRQMLAAAA